MGWGSGNLGGAGGGLNFVVKQYTTTPTGAAKEKTIGVVTDTAITSWVMQAEQPTGAEGMVWIEVAATSDVAFYADKKQQVKLYPKSVKQYVGGAWSNMDAYIYQGGAWVLFSQALFYLYDRGDLCESITGGWNKSGYAEYSVSFATDYINLWVKPSSEGYKGRANAFTANKIDLTNFASLHCTVDRITRTAGSTPEVYLCLSQSTPTTEQGSYSAKLSGVSEVPQNISLDVSSVTGSWYVYVQLIPTTGTSHGSSNMTANVSKVWCEQ